MAFMAARQRRCAIVVAAIGRQWRADDPRHGRRLARLRSCCRRRAAVVRGRVPGVGARGKRGRHVRVAGAVEAARRATSRARSGSADRAEGRAALSFVAAHATRDVTRNCRRRRRARRDRRAPRSPARRGRSRTRRCERRGRDAVARQQEGRATLRRHHREPDRRVADRVRTQSPASRRTIASAQRPAAARPAAGWSSSASPTRATGSCRRWRASGSRSTSSSRSSTTRSTMPAPTAAMRARAIRVVDFGCRQGLPDLRRPRAPAPALRRRARGHRRRAARRPGRVLQRRRPSAARCSGPALRAGRPAQASRPRRST